LFGKEYGLPTVSLRYFTVYGPRQRPDMAFNKIIKSGLEKSEFHLYGDGSQVRDFTFVSDVAQANLLAATSEVEPGSVFNIGGGSPVTMTYAIEKIQEILGVEILIEQESFGLGNPMITEADCSAARESLNWHPKVRIDEGLALQIEWQRSSYEGLSF
jgi:UDP-glucuronate 4-epimerase